MTSRVAKSPMEFVVTLQCEGSIDCEKFTQAILLEIKQHPLLQANAEIGPNHRQSYWKVAAEPLPQINWIEKEFLPEQGFPEDFEPIDLKSEIGLRFYGWHYGTESTQQVVMKFAFHHACCDGKAGLDFVEQALVRYGSLFEGADASIETDFQSDRISDRDTQAIQSLKFLDRIVRSVVVRPKRVAKFLFQRPLMLRPNVESKDIDSEKLYDDPPRQCSITIDQNRTKALGEFARSHDSTTNLVLARELFHTLNIRQDDSNGSGDSGRFRLMIPYSLRDDRRHEVQVANCVSIVYLEATKRSLSQDTNENPVLLTQLGKQMDYIRRWQLEYSWIESIESYAKFWPVIKLFKNRKTSEGKPKKQKGLEIATAAMTNLGRAFNNERWAASDGKIKVGSLEVETVHVAVPCTEKLNTNFSVNFYRDRLTLDIIYLPSLVSRETAQSVLDSWAQRITRLVELG